MTSGEQMELKTLQLHILETMVIGLPGMHFSRDSSMTRTRTMLLRDCPLISGMSPISATFGRGAKHSIFKCGDAHTIGCEKNGLMSS